MFRAIVGEDDSGRTSRWKVLGDCTALDSRTREFNGPTEDSRRWLGLDHVGVAEIKKLEVFLEQILPVRGKKYAVGSHRDASAGFAARVVRR